MGSPSGGAPRSPRSTLHAGKSERASREGAADLGGVVCGGLGVWGDRPGEVGERVALLELEGEEIGLF